MNRRPTLIFCAFSLFLLIFAGCGGDESSSSGIGRTKTLVAHALSDPTGMNPHTSVGATTDYIHSLIFDKILTLDHETLELRPTISESMPEISADKLAYTFKLKKDVTFSDGEPLTAEDVVFTFKAMMNPFVDSGPVRGELHNFVDCVALDEYTVQFKLKNSGPSNLDKLAIYFYVMPKHIYDWDSLTNGYTSAEGAKACEDRQAVDPVALDKMKTFSISYQNENFNRAKDYVIGSGRYVFDGWETGQYIRLVKNDNYWNKSSSHPFAMQGMDTIIFKTINDIETALISLKSKEIDFSNNFKPSQVKDKMSGPEFAENFNVKTIPYPFYEYIGWNQAIKDQPHRNFFADVRVRTAMSHLVNVDEIIDKVMYGAAVPVNSMVYYERPEYNKALEGIQYNEEKALALLHQAGWDDLDGDGVLENKDGVRFEFKMIYRQGNDVRKNIALILQENFKKVGILMEPQAMDWSIMLERLKRKELDAWIGAWVFDSNEQDFYQLFHSSQISNEGYNWTCYSNPETDRLMVAIQTEWDMETRYELHREVQRVLFDDQPYTMLFGNMARIAYNNRIDTKHWYGQRPCFDLPQFELVSGGTQPN